MPSESVGPEHRVGRRFPWENDVELTWIIPDGTTVRERACTQMVSASGASVRMRFFWKDLKPQDEVDLKNHLSGKSARVRVVEVRPAGKGRLANVTVKFV